MAQNEDPVPSPSFGIFARVLIAEAVKKVQVAYPAIVTAYYPPNTTTKNGNANGMPPNSNVR